MSVPNLRILEGDCFQILPKLDTESVDLCLTSPPYNVGKEYDVDMTENEYIDWITEWMCLVHPVLKETGVLVLNIGDKVTKIERSTRIPRIWLNAVETAGYHYIELYIWNKGKMLPIKSRYRSSNVFEYCFWFSKSLDFMFNPDAVRRPYNPVSIRRMDYKIKKRWSRERDTQYHEYKDWAPDPRGALPKNILDLGSESSNRGHTAVFPEKLATWFIKAATNEGDTVLDPFLGSGTTMKVAADLGRNCIGIEMNPTYVGMARQRVHNAGHDVQAFVLH